MSRSYADPDLGPGLCPGYRRPALCGAVVGPYVPRPKRRSRPKSRAKSPARAGAASRIKPKARAVPERFRVRAWRTWAGLTQAEFAEKTGASPWTVYAWEAGRKPIPPELFVLLDMWTRESQ